MKLQTAITGVSAVFDTGSSATSDTVIRGAIHQCVQEAVSEARWRKVRRELGPTVLGTSTYEVDEDIVAILSLRVAASRPYLRCGLETLVELQVGTGRLVRGAVGAFCPQFEDLAEGAAEATADGDTSLVEIFPTPTASGQVIQTISAVRPLTIDASTNAATFEIGVPEDLARRIAIDGPIATLWEDALGRADLATPYRARFENGKQELERRGNARVGSGRVNVPIVRP